MTVLASLGQIVGPQEIGAVVALIIWLGVCWYYLAPRRPASSGENAAVVDWLIIHASQSGNARRIAEQLADSLAGEDGNVALMALNDLSPERMKLYSRALLVISTYGEGEPPDNGAAFWRKARSLQSDLRNLNYALLALGDSQYAGYCAFGRQLAQWLSAAGAQPILPLQEVDKLSPPTLLGWQQQLSHVTGQRIILSDDFRRWTLLQRQLLNPDSPGAPAWLLRLQPLDRMPVWQAGDLAQVRIGNVLRSYSIASLPEDGVLELIVRQVTHADGQLGQGSGWLCCHARPGDEVDVQLLPNPRFHLPDCPAPLILIGAGTGLAGLRGLLRQQQHRDGLHATWLIFGERCQQHDRWLMDELEPLEAAGQLCLDRCFSRHPEQPEYLQHRLHARAEQLRQWVDKGARIHVCGSLEGMGEAVHHALQTLLTSEQWQSLQQHNRYRRDLY